jgi:hypothetical protein
MESKIDKISYDETDNAMREEILNGEKNVGSLGCGKVKRKLDENRCLCNTDYDIPDNCGPKKGDLIEIKRSLMIVGYDHWAVYVGDGEVIHLCDVGDCKATVRLDQLKEVCGESLCRINNLEEAARKRRLKPRSVGDILSHAYNMVDKELKYHPIENNCEHFVTSCRFGLRFSEQAEAAKMDPTGFTQLAVPLVTKVIMEANSIIDDSSETSEES